MEQKNIYNLTHRKLTGQITGAELLLLEELSKEEENRNLISNIEHVWAETANLEDLTFDSSNAYQQFLQKTNQNSSTEEIIKPPTRVINLWRAATAIAAIFVLGLFVINQFKNEVLTHSYEEGAIVTLEDQSKIYLSEGSHINYPENFRKKRSVELMGKAVFEVAKKQGKEFSVIAGNTKITVLGTTFLVETHQNESQNVAVIEGKVKVDNDKNQIVISDREGVEIQPDGEFEKREDISFIGNKIYQPSLTYDNTPLTKVLADLEVKFNIEFSIRSSADYSQCKFTSKNLEQEPLEDIITILESTFGAEIIQQDGGKYQVKRLSCK